MVFGVERVAPHRVFGVMRFAFYCSSLLFPYGCVTIMCLLVVSVVVALWRVSRFIHQRTYSHLSLLICVPGIEVGMFDRYVG